MARPQRVRDNEDEEIARSWVIHPDDDFRQVTADRIRHEPEWPWEVGVSVMEFVRDEETEAKLSDAVTKAIRRVRGVREAEQQDREVWVVSGLFISGASLVKAVDAAIGRCEPDLRRLLDEQD